MAIRRTLTACQGQVALDQYLDSTYCNPYEGGQIITTLLITRKIHLRSFLIASYH